MGRYTSMETCPSCGTEFATAEHVKANKRIAELEQENERLAKSWMAMEKRERATDKAIDELREELKSVEPELQAIKDFYENAETEKRFGELELRIQSENFWQDPKHIEISKEHQRVKNLVDEYKTLTSGYRENFELLDLLLVGSYFFLIVCFRIVAHI